MLSNNQAKVIKDKYLFKNESVEDLFNRVSYNIALAEILFHKDIKKYLKDVNFELIDNQLLLFHSNLNKLEDRENNFEKVISTLKNIPFTKEMEVMQKKFYDLLSNFKFLPGSPTLMNAGTKLQQLSSCFVVDVEDSMDGINTALSASSIIQKTGGGVGYNFGKIRPKGAKVKSTDGIASGVLSFMKVFDTFTDVIKQGGRRRGAMIALLPYHHPEIMDFVNSKQKEGMFTNFNISVGLDAKFFELLKDGKDFNLLDPSNGKVVGKLNSTKFFNSLVDSAWTSGDPGIIFLDRINSEQSNPTPHIGNIEAVNPCFTGDMRILTENGYVKFEDLEDKEVNIINKDGNISKSKIWCSGEKDVIELVLNNGSFNKSLKCTKDHVLMDMFGNELEAKKSLNKVLMCYTKDKKVYVKEIKDLGRQKVYDFTESLTHWGVVEDIIVHNCGELNLLYWESCNLGSINLSKYIEDSKWNTEVLKEDIKTCVRFLDNVVEINNYPLPQIERMTKSNRRIGLGLMGWAESLVKLGISYNSSEALKEADCIMSIINDTAKEASEELAKERGSFYNWKGSLYDTKYNIQMRNCTRTMIAPTGTISIAAGLQGSGIEPFFGIVYTRYNAKALEALKNNETPKEEDVFFEVNPLFEECAKENKYFGMSKEELYKKIDANHKSLKGIKEIPEYIQELFITAHDVGYIQHVNMQASFQKHVDCSISKTINMQNDATKSDIQNAYMSAYQMGCKGITVYRDGCKAQQVLNISTITPKKEVKPKSKAKYGSNANYYNIETGYGPLHVHINHEDNIPTQIFVNLPPIGTEISGLTSLVGLLISKYLEQGGDPKNILKHLNSIRGDKPYGFGKNRVESIPHAISKALKDFIKAEDIKQPNQVGTLYCPKCYSSNVSMLAGCSGPTCHDCGYSQCS